MSRRMEREGFTTYERVRAARRNPQRHAVPPHFALKALPMVPPMRAHHVTALEGAAIYRRWVESMRSPLEYQRRQRGMRSARLAVVEAANYRTGGALHPYRPWARLP